MSDFYDDMVTSFFNAKCEHYEELLRFEKYAKCKGRDSIWTCKDGTKVRIKDMSDKEKIREFIKNRMNTTKDKLTIVYSLLYNGMAKEDEEILSFIDNLSEENIDQ